MNKSTLFHSGFRHAVETRCFELAGRQEVLADRGDALQPLAAVFEFLDQLLIEIEFLEPDNLPDVCRLVELYREEIVTMPSSGSANAEALKLEVQERDNLLLELDLMIERDFNGFELLPYRRTLPAKERELWLERISKRWLLDDTSDWWSYYGQLVDGSRNDGMIISEDDFHQQELAMHLRKRLKQSGCGRVVNVCEGVSKGEYSRSLDIEYLQPAYYGSESFWTSHDLDWLIHVTHESLIVLGGCSASIVSSMLEAKK